MVSVIVDVDVSASRGAQAYTHTHSHSHAQTRHFAASDGTSCSYPPFSALLPRRQTEATDFLRTKIVYTARGWQGLLNIPGVYMQ